MEPEISKSQFKARALEIFRRVEATGEPVIVTDHGTPKLMLRKYVGHAGASARDKLRGSVLHYSAPHDPAADDDWDASE